MENLELNKDIKELTEFLSPDVAYEVVGDRVVAEEVDLSNFGITQLPESIGRLQCDRLYLYDNQLTSLPDSFVDLKGEYLDLGYNQLTSLPESIGRLQFDSLGLSDNNLTSLPDSFGDLKCKDLYLYNNPLTSESKQLLEKLKSAGVNVNY